MHRLTVAKLLILVALAVMLGSLFGARPASAMCRPGSLTLLPKPSFEPPRCDPYPQ